MNASKINVGFGGGEISASALFFPLSANYWSLTQKCSMRHQPQRVEKERVVSRFSGAQHLTGRQKLHVPSGPRESNDCCYSSPVLSQPFKQLDPNGKSISETFVAFCPALTPPPPLAPCPPLASYVNTRLFKDLQRILLVVLSTQLRPTSVISYVAVRQMSGCRTKQRRKKKLECCILKHVCEELYFSEWHIWTDAARTVFNPDCGKDQLKCAYTDLKTIFSSDVCLTN